MSYTKTHYLSVFIPSLLLGFVAALQLTGCGATPAGLASAGAGGDAELGGAAPAAGGTTGNGGEAGSSSEASGGSDAGEASGGAEASEAEGGSTASGGSIENGGTGGGEGGTLSSGGEAGGAISGGSGGQEGSAHQAVIPAYCPFHTDPPADSGAAGGGGTGGGGTGGGSGGTGGSGGSTYNVTLQTSPFVGSYLADATGRTLYTFGNDLPGDCNTPPISNCVTDCLISWPIFPAGARVLAPGLDDAAFGAIQRSDGSWQTTYFGWPLYYYKTDLLQGQVAGQGKAKTWHIVEKKLPAVFIMKPGSVKYLADVAGHTLYVSAQDLAGTVTSDPVSNCTGSCLSTFEPFHEKNFSVVTSLLISDFSSFARPGTNGIQVAYKGMPLYRAVTDLKSGDMNGTAVSSFTAALP